MSGDPTETAAVTSGLDPRVASVLRALEERSAKERAEMEVLRAVGALRERAAAFMLDVGPESGLFLNTLVRSARARTVLEVGGSVGYSTLWLAEAVQATGGRVYSIEPVDGKRAEQRANLRAAGLADVVELTACEAPELVPALPAPLDLVLLDHWKELYVRDFEACWPAVAPGGLVVADNILTPRKNAVAIAAYRRHLAGLSDARSQVMAVGAGLEVTVKCDDRVIDERSSATAPSVSSVTPAPLDGGPPR
ncbi:O-methyltransferase [Streptomyces huiliensis]|uniref:O-methyltransferase n=1 Tax=Streptomyces huiliensis TaxID=2876027 RepID=UPI001CC04899|nr:class I SAM-dependent methyltransferase [Streptomyces huiliensis]MBZ4321104.1 class I SAM-dependent methyltransferase [Streptomyces huiliensis]